MMKENKLIIYIVGNSRSGTTMLGRIFGNHSQVNNFGELHFFEQEVDAISIKERVAWPRSRRLRLLERLLTTSREGFFRKVVTGRYASEAERILISSQYDDPLSVYEMFLRFESARINKIVPCEQTPRYLFYVEEILAAFPHAKVINIIRDPRDVLLSQKNKWRRRYLGAKNIPLSETFRSWVNYHPYTISRIWVAAVRTARRLEGHPRYLSILFEDLLQSPDSTVQLLCAFVGITFEQTMLDVPQIGSSMGKDRPEQKGIDGSRSGSWRNGGLSDIELAICQDVARDDMNRLGYSVESISVSVWRTASSMVVFGFKAVAALILNLHRTTKLRETLRRRWARSRFQI